MKISILVVVLALAVTVESSLEPLREDRIHVVDKHQETRFLFRGNQPMNDKGEFDMENLRKYIKSVADKEGKFELRDGFKIVDISLLQPEVHEDEKAALDREKEFFTKDPKEGELVSWPLYGDSKAPEEEKDPRKRSNLAATLNDWQQDKLDEKVDTLHKWINNEDEQPLEDEDDRQIVYYFHCGHGQDRTGELAGAYMLKYLDKSFEHVWDFNTKIGMDVPENLNSLVWYCLYLNTQNFKLKCVRGK